MKKILYPLAIVLLLPISTVFGQTNFRQGWEEANPVEKGGTLPIEEKINAHEAFLKDAQIENNSLKQLYAHLYLAYDYYFTQDYAMATEELLQAEAIANQSGNPGWLGWVIHRKAIISSRMLKTEDALEEYKEAARLCGEARDSLCVAESLEQVSVMYGKLDDFDNAQRFHDIAMPLIEKYGGDAQLGASLNNYGNVHNWQGRAAEALPYFKRAIEIYRKLGRQMEMAKTMNNLADALRYVHRFDEAEQLLQECIRINQENGFLESLRTNYANMSVLYDSMGNYKAAFKYLDKYYYLNDSLIGAETQRKIAELEISYDIQGKELELEKSRSSLALTRRTSERRLALVILVLLLSAAGLWRWRLQTWQAKRQLDINRENLKNLTQLLIEKNKQLADFSGLVEKDGMIEKEPINAPIHLESDIFKKAILTEADWTSFKAHFEKVYPGYQYRLRQTYPELSISEERLFLLFKLNLNTKEAATLLGIMPESVKKTRTRLRKRLRLDESVDLQEFIGSF